MVAACLAGCPARLSKASNSRRVSRSANYRACQPVSLPERQLSIARASSTRRAMSQEVSRIRPASSSGSSIVTCMDGAPQPVVAGRRLLSTTGHPAGVSIVARRGGVRGFERVSRGPASNADRWREGLLSGTGVGSSDRRWPDPTAWPDAEFASSGRPERQTLR